MTGRVKKRTGIEPALARSEEPVLPDIGNPPWAACTIPARDVNPSRAVPADKLYPEWTYPVNIPIAPGRRAGGRNRVSRRPRAQRTGISAPSPDLPPDREGGVIRCWYAGSVVILAGGCDRSVGQLSHPLVHGLDVRRSV